MVGLHLVASKQRTFSTKPYNSDGLLILPPAVQLFRKVCRTSYVSRLFSLLILPVFVDGGVIRAISTSTLDYGSAVRICSRPEAICLSFSDEPRREDGLWMWLVLTFRRHHHLGRWTINKDSQAALDQTPGLSSCSEGRAFSEDDDGVFMVSGKVIGRRPLFRPDWA